MSGSLPLKTADPVLHDLIQKEEQRQAEGLELIASENFTSRAVMDCLGSALTNKYSEGLPGARYYGGNQFIDQIETLCQDRALQAFGLDKQAWGVNVQPYSGSPANFAVYTALLEPHQRIMGLDLPSGGHLTHGYYTPKKKISATSIFFESLPYSVDPETGLVDYEALQASAQIFRPRLIICGGSAYSREWDYARLRQIADSVNCYLMMDMAHISGLVATKVAKNPFEHCHIVTTTTHKTLRGPRAGMIFFRRDKQFNFEARINFAVFPSLQGGPHNNTIAGVAAQLLEVQSPAFKDYCQQVVKNCQALAAELVKRGHKLVTGGSDNHLILWDLRPHGMTGSKLEDLCDRINVTLNKNAVPGDYNALSPAGVRVGTPAMTTRGSKEADWVKIADVLDRACLMAKAIQDKAGSKQLKAFQDVCVDAEFAPKIKALRDEVEHFAKAFYMPGKTLTAE